MEPDISSFRRQFFTARAAVGCNGPLPGYQVEPSEPAPTKPISLGLANFQQARPEKEANLPVSLSRGLAHMSGNNSRGEKTGMGKS